MKALHRNGLVRNHFIEEGTLQTLSNKLLTPDYTLTKFCRM